MKRLLLLTLAGTLLLLLAPTPTGARRIRTGPSRVPRSTQTATDTATAVNADTILAPDPDAVRLSGFDKTLRSPSESFFVTNSLPDSSTIIRLTVTFDYFDMQGRQLHSADHTIPCRIPPRATRRLSVPSWDSQHTFYYHRSPAPRRSSATPFTVRSTLRSAITITRQHEF